MQPLNRFRCAALAVLAVLTVWLFWFRYDVPAAHTRSPTCRQEDPVALYTSLYTEYKEGLLETRALAAAFCANSSVKPPSMPHYHHCLTGMMESEVLYLRLRCARPTVVLEVSSALGYSTLWILMALHHNGHGVLHSFDLLDTPFPYVLPDSTRSRWIFHKGNMEDTFSPVLTVHTPDYLHIDTCHDEPCIRWYLRHVLGAVAAAASKEHPVLVSAHDLYDTYYPLGANAATSGNRAPSPEGVMFLEWLAFAGTASHVHTLAAGFSTIGEQVWAIRRQVLGEAAAEQLPTWDKLKNKDFTASVYFELRGLSNLCKDCMPRG